MKKYKGLVIVCALLFLWVASVLWISGLPSAWRLYGPEWITNGTYAAGGVAVILSFFKFKAYYHTNQSNYFEVPIIHAMTAAVLLTLPSLFSVTSF